MKNYKLTNNTIEYNGITLHQIEAINDFKDIKIGDLGGYVQSLDNLSNNAWVYGDAKVYGNAIVSGDAKVYDDVEVYGNAKVSGHAKVYGNAQVLGDARVFGNARVSDDAQVYGDARVGSNSQVFGNAKVGGEARVFGEACLYGDAEVYGKAMVYDNAKVFDAEVYGKARVYGNAQVFGDVSATRRVFYLECMYGLTLTDNHITYGCIQRTIEEWKEFLISDEVIETPRDDDKFKLIRLTLELVIEQHKQLLNDT